MTDRSGRAVPLLLLVLAVPFVLKLCLLRVDKVFETHTMAVEWLASGLFRHHYMGSWDAAFQFPVYTAMLAYFYALGLGGKVVLAFQVLCSTLTAWLVQRLALHLLHGRPYARRVALLAAAAVGLSPFLAYYQVRMIHPFAWDTLLATALCYGASVARPAQRTSVVALFVLGGVALLNRPTLGVFMLPFLIRERAFLFSLRAVPQKVGLLVLLVAPLATWMLRNKVVTGRFQLTSVTDQMVWMGVQEETEGSGQLPGGENYLDLLSMAERRALFNMDPVARDTFFRDKWRSEVREQPGLRWRMFLVKLRNFWLFRSQPGADHHAATWTLVSFKVYATAMLLLLLLALALRDRALRSLLWSVFLLSVVQCAFYFETRHRLLVEPLLLLVVLASCAELFQRLKRPHPAEQAQ